MDAEEEQNIVIGGLGIHKEHASILRTQKTSENGTVEDQLLIQSLNNSKVYVNGVPLKDDQQQQQLHHCDRVILGVANAFRVRCWRFLMLV